MQSRRNPWVTAAAAAVVLIANVAAAAPGLKVLIVDGQNNHKWAATTPVMKELFEGSGRFTVDVATSPPKGKPMDGFKPEFAKYDVVVSNYTGADWPKETQDAFVKYIAGGGGLVIFHAADNAFPKWKEFNEMIGLGGWGGRNEASGPYVYWKDGKYVRDTSPGKGGGHGARTPYQVRHRDTEHPITKGLPDKWMHCADELYCRMRGPAKNMTILATGYSDPKTKGSGREEPLLWTVAYEKGRVFHTVLGHDVPQMQCVGFIVTLLRGTEWAATGEVTLTKVPDDFPKPDAVSLRAGAKGPEGAAGKTGGLAAYKQGDSRAGWVAIEEQIRAAATSPTKLAAIEAKLLGVLKAPGATFDAKQYVCRILRQIATDQSVPALAKLLDDEKLSHMARHALHRLSGDVAGQALRDALGRLKGDERIGVIDTLGRRGDRKAVAQLFKMLAGADGTTAGAIVSALGNIGGREAADALGAAKVAEELATLKADAILRCADSLAEEGRTDAAAAIYRKAAAPNNPTMIRVAAYRGLALVEKEKAVPVLAELLKSPDADLQRAAGKFLAELPGPAATKALADQLPALSSSGKVSVLGALAARGDRSVAALVTKAAGSEDSAVAAAAVNALGVLGDAGSVDLLAAKTAAPGELGAAARLALTRLGGKGVDAAIAKFASRGETGVRAGIIDVLRTRRATGAMDVFFTAAGDDDRGIRAAGFKAIGELGGAGTLPKLVAMLIDPSKAALRGEVQRAMGSVAARAGGGDAATAVVVDAMKGADNATKSSLLDVLPKLGGAKALAVVRGYLGDASDEVKLAAIRALSSWRDPAPMADLLKVAKTDPSETNHILAMRAYVKMLSMPAKRSPKATTALLAEALKAAKRPQEKKTILSTLTKFPCDASLKLAESLMNDEQLSGEASLARQKIKGAMKK